MQGTEVKLSKGDWVFHPRMPGWGYGKILELIGDKKGRVLFLLAGEKKMSWEHAGLGLVEDDDVSRDTLNDQLVEFKLNLARHLLTSEELSPAVTCAPCDTPGSKCELCKSASGGRRVYSLAQEGKMCLCDGCRDKIMLETKDSAAINLSVAQMEKRSKKAAESEKKQKKLKIVRKSK